MVLVLQATITNKSWAHEQTSAQFAKLCILTPAIGYGCTRDRTSHNVSCLRIFHEEDQPRARPRAQRAFKPAGCWAWLILRLSHSSLWRGRGMWNWREGIKYFILGEPLEMACKANPPLCRLSWEMTVPVFYRGLSCAQCPFGACTPKPNQATAWLRYRGRKPSLLLALQEQINGKQVCCIRHVNWASAPQICFFSSPFYLVFNTEQPPPITSRLKTLSD